MYKSITTPGCVILEPYNHLGFFLAQPGIHEGLSILIDSHDNYLDGSTVNEDYQGFIGMFLHVTYI